MAPQLLNTSPTSKGGIYPSPLKLHGENRPKTLRNPAKSIGGNWLKKENLLPKKKKIRSLFPL